MDAKEYVASLVSELRRLYGDTIRTSPLLDDTWRATYFKEKLSASLQASREVADLHKLSSEELTCNNDLLSRHYDRAKQSFEQEMPSFHERAAFGEPSLVSTFDYLIRRVTLAAADFPGPPTKFAAFALLPLPIPNACTFLVPGTHEPVVIFQDCLPVFLSKMAKIICAISVRAPIDPYNAAMHAMMFGTKEGTTTEIESLVRLLNSTINDAQDLSDLFLITMYCLLVVGDIYESPSITLDRDSDFVRDALLASMELFIIGHELGHVYHGHTRSATSNVVSMGNKQIRKVTPPVHDEIVADMMGLSLMTKCVLDDYGDSSPEVCATGESAPDVFFSIMKSLYKFLSIAIGREYTTIYDSHPPPGERRQKIRQFREHARDLAHGTDRNPYESSPALIEGLKSGIILDILTARTLPVFQSCVERGEVLSPVWRL